MTNVNTATRTELEIAILENNLESLFGSLDQIIETETEEIRAKLVEWVLESPEN